MTDERWEWAPGTVEEIAATFAGAPFRWWFTGGIALELFAGRSWREHEDIDLGICRADAPSLYSWLGELEACIAAGGRLRPWEGEPLFAHRPENNVWVRRSPGGPFFLDIAIGDGDASEWRYRRDPRIRRTWEDSIRKSPDGLPYLAPEIQLLFKSKGQRDKDTLDARMVLPLVDEKQRAWLRDHLPAGHGWHTLLAASSRDTVSVGGPR